MQNIEPERIAVAVGLILDSENKILIGQRTVQDAYLGKWEFPGGKIEPAESADEALHRELWEEIGISVIDTVHFMTFEYDYPDRKVLLDFRLVSHYDGTPVAREQQNLRWVQLAQLGDFDMLAPNVCVIEALRHKYG
ncbi:MAG: 8-oxo-dGTP diphosphatase MutT [Acidiferrobacterales bacterium]|nr:8-oxo-dGTP diphosphatase MutT [Acidiferrobacterales bacterium]